MSQREPESTDPSPDHGSRQAQSTRAQSTRAQSTRAKELCEDELSRVAGGQSFWFPGLTGEKPKLRTDKELEGLGPKIE